MHIYTRVEINNIIVADKSIGKALIQIKLAMIKCFKQHLHFLPDCMKNWISQLVV